MDKPELKATLPQKNGRSALVMANSASDARHSEADIRKTLIGKNIRVIAGEE